MITTTSLVNIHLKSGFVPALTPDNSIFSYTILVSRNRKHIFLPLIIRSISVLNLQKRGLIKLVTRSNKVFSKLRIAG